MEKEFIRHIQKQVIGLLRTYSNKPLCISSKDNCSEVARLVGCWIFKKFPTCKMSILKGKNIQGTKNQNHDILAVEYNKNIDLIDPTVWQFFKNKKSIFIKTTNNLEDGLFEAEKYYGGKWNVSEILKVNDYKKDELKKMIVSNIKESARRAKITLIK